NSSQNTGGGGRIRGMFSGNRKKGPATAIIVLVLGALGFGGIFFGAALAPIAAIHTLTDDLDDLLPSVHIRQEKIQSKKFSRSAIRDLRSPTSLGCGRVLGTILPVKCRYNTMSK